jgi:hypothetical protein
VQSLSDGYFEENSNEIVFTSNNQIRKGQILLIKKRDNSQSIYVSVNSVSDDGLIINLIETIPFNNTYCDVYLVKGIAYGSCSHTEGSDTVASGSCSHAEGVATTASGLNSHAEGSWTTASGGYSHAEGYISVASGNYSHVEGYDTVAYNSGEHAEGAYNVSNKGIDEDIRKTRHSIGIGSTENNRKNAHEVMDNGDTFIVGIGEYDGTNPYEAKTLQ